MPNSTKNIQILYEISLSMGNSKDLIPMVTEALSTYVKRLGCISGSVYQVERMENRGLPYSHIKSIPRYVSGEKEILEKYFIKRTGKKNSHFTEKLPLIIEKEKNSTHYIFDLPGFGFMILSTRGLQFETLLLKQLEQLNQKFANHCKSCLNNLALSISENKYRTISNSVQDVYFRSNSAGIITEISPSTYRYIGFTQDEVLGSHMRSFFLNELDFKNLTRETEVHGEVLDYQTTVLKKDGSQLPVSVNAKIEIDDDGKFLGYHGTVRDISEHQKIIRELESRENYQRLINYFSTSLLGTNTTNEILWDISYNCISKLGFEDCIVYLINEKDRYLYQAAAFGKNKEKDYTVLNPITIPIGSGVVGTVAKTGKAEIIDDVTTDSRYIVDDEPRMSELTVPIIYEGNVLGIIDSESSVKAFYTQEHLHILKSIASLAANKIMRARSEESRKNAEALRAGIIEGALDCVITINSDGLITDFNPAAVRTFGYSVEEAIGKSLTETIMPEKYHDGHNKGMKRFFSTGISSMMGQRIEIEAKRANGEVFPVELSLTPIKIDKITVVTAYIRDLTEKFESARTMKLQADVMEAAANGIIITDLNGKIVWTNPAFLKMTGFEAEDILDKPTRILKSEAHDSEFYKEMWETISNGDVWSGELINRKKDGSTYPEDMTITPIKNPKGEITNYVAIKQDITERKKAENVLRDSERMKTGFVSSVSHELRTPLASILGFSGTILRDKNMTPETKNEFVKIIYDESQRLTRLIENVLDISKIESGTISFTKEHTRVENILLDVIESQKILATKKNVSLSNEIQDDLPMVFLSKDGLKQVLVNLISNAIKFTDPGGKVSMKVNVIEDTLVIEIRDSGIGIPQSEIDKIYDRFFRVHREKRQDEGTGIGLAITKEIIDQHNGEISVKSVVGQGTVFTVKLPIEEDFKA